MNGRLDSSNIWKVADGTNITSDGWIAATSYLRNSRLITLPSPNQPPGGTPDSVQLRPHAF
ncbi:hypothetical protein OKW36_003819 [Paraburkholderia sp. MM5482-R1]